MTPRCVVIPTLLATLVPTLFPALHARRLTLRRFASRRLDGRPAPPVVDGRTPDPRSFLARRLGPRPPSAPSRLAPERRTLLSPGFTVPPAPLDLQRLAPHRRPLPTPPLSALGTTPPDPTVAVGDTPQIVGR